MKTDKELLELAAKAAGLNVKMIEVDQDDNFNGLIVGKRGTKERICWNPLKSDGDALHLAVKLKVDVIPSRGDNCVCVIGGGDHFEEPQAPNEFSSMRRAIVRAAAAIGGGAVMSISSEVLVSKD